MPSSHELVPTPGAYVFPAALAAELVAKAARQTAAVEDPFAVLAEDMEHVAAEADELRLALLALTHEHERAFARVLAARRLGERERIQAAYAAAVEPPLRACDLSLRVLELAVEVEERGHPQTGAESVAAALFAAASAESAALTVDLELGPIEDEELRSARGGEAEQARERALLLRGQALTTIAMPRRLPLAHAATSRL